MIGGDSKEEEEINLNNQVFAGYTTWRVPTLEELASLLQSKKTDKGFIDPMFDIKEAICWSADNVNGFGCNNCWGTVNFAGGTIFRFGPGNHFNVRAVCSGVEE